MLHLDWDTLSSKESANFLQNRANEFLSTVPDLVLQTIKEKLTSGDTAEGDATTNPAPDAFKPPENLLDLAKHPLKFLRISPISNVRLSHLSLGSRAPVIQIRGLTQATPDVIDTFFRVLEASPPNGSRTASNPSTTSSMVVTPVPIALSLPVPIATKILKFAKALSRPRYIICPSDTDLNPVQDSGGFGYTSPSPRPTFDQHAGVDVVPSRTGDGSAPRDSVGARMSIRAASALQASLASTPHEKNVSVVPGASPRRGRHSPTSRDTLRTPAPRNRAPNSTAPARSPQPTPVTTAGLSGVDSLLTLELALDSDLDAHVQADLQVANPFAEWAAVQIDHSHCKHAQVRDEAKRLAAVLRGHGLGDAVARIDAAVPGSDAPDVAVVPPAPAATLPLGVRVRGVKVAAQVHVMVLATDDAKARARTLLRECGNDADDAPAAGGAPPTPGKLARKQQALARLIPDVYVCVTAPAVDPFASVAALQDRSELSYALAHVPLDDSYAASVGLSSLAADEHAALAGFSGAQGPSTVVLNDLDVSLEFGAVSTLLKPLEAFLVGRIRTEVERAIAGRVVRLKLDVALEQPAAEEGKDDAADNDHDSDDTDEDEDARAKYLHRYSAFLDPTSAAARDSATPGKNQDFGNTFDSRLFTPGTFRRRSALDDSHLHATRTTADVDRRGLASAAHAPTPRARARSASPDKVKKQENEYANSPIRGLSTRAAAEAAAEAEAAVAVAVDAEESASVAPSLSGHVLSSTQVRKRMQRMQRYNASLPKVLSAQHNTQHPARSRSPVFDDAASVSSMGSFRSLVSAGGLSEIGNYLGSRNFSRSAQFRALSPATRSTSSFHTAVSPSTAPNARDLMPHPPAATHSTTPSTASVPVLAALATPHRALRPSAAPTPLLAPARTPSLSRAHTPSFTHMRARTPSRPSSAASSRIFTAVPPAHSPSATPAQPPHASTPSMTPATPATQPLPPLPPASADPPPAPAPALAPPPALSSAASECLLLSPLNPHQRAILAAAGEHARFHAPATAPHTSLSTPALVFAATDALVELAATAPARAGSESMCSDASTQESAVTVSLREGAVLTPRAAAPSAPAPPSPTLSAASSMPGLEPLAHTSAYTLTHTQPTPVSTATDAVSPPAAVSLASLTSSGSAPVAPEQESDAAVDGDNDSLDGVLRDLLLARGEAHPAAASVAASSIPSNVYAALGKMMHADDTDNDTDAGADVDAGRSFDPEHVSPTASASRASHSVAPSPLLRPHARAEPASAAGNMHARSPLHAAEPRTPRRGSGAGRESSDAPGSLRKSRAAGKYNTINFGTPSRNKTPGKPTPSRFSQFPDGDASEGELDASSILPPLLSPYPGQRPGSAALAQPVFTIADPDADADSASIAPSDAPTADTAASAASPSFTEAQQLGLGLGDLETSFRLPSLVAPTPRKAPAPRATTAASGVRATPPAIPATALATAQTTPRGTPAPLLFTHVAPADSDAALPVPATGIPPVLAALASPRRAAAAAPAAVAERSLSRSSTAQLPFSPAARRPFALSRTHTPIPAPTPTMHVSRPPPSTPLVDGRSLSFIATPTSSAPAPVSVPAPVPAPTNTPVSTSVDASTRGGHTRPLPAQPVVFSASPLPTRAPTLPTSPTSPRGPTRALPVSRSLSGDALGDGPQRDISPQRITKAADLLFYKYRAPATEAPAAAPRRTQRESPSAEDSGFAQDISRITFSGIAPPARATSGELAAQELSGSFLNNTTLSLNAFAGMASPTRTYGARPLPLAQTPTPRPSTGSGPRPSSAATMLPVPRSNATPDLASPAGRPTLSFLASPPPATPPSADPPTATFPPSPALSTALSTATAVIPLPLPPFTPSPSMPPHTLSGYGPPSHRHTPRTWTPLPSASMRRASASAIFPPKANASPFVSGSPDEEMHTTRSSEGGSSVAALSWLHRRDEHALPTEHRDRKSPFVAVQSGAW